MVKMISILSIFFLNLLVLHEQLIKYPYPVKYSTTNIEDQHYSMAFMDVKPSKPHGESVILFHGKKFNGYYWKDVISFLSNAGYRVIIPTRLVGANHLSLMLSIHLKC